MRHDKLCTASIFERADIFERRRLTCTGVEVALIVGSVAAAATTASAVHGMVTSPDMPGDSGDMPPLPPNATDAEKAARDAANAAKRKQVGLASSGDGRSSTNLTGGRLGEVGQPNLQPKTLLGL